LLPKHTGGMMHTSGMQKMRFGVVAVFSLLCLVGLSSMDGEGKMGELQQAARQVIGNIMEQQIPDAPDELAPVDTLVAENELVEAVRQENEQSLKTDDTVTPAMSVATETTDATQSAETGSANMPETTQVSQITQVQEQLPSVSGQEVSPLPTPQPEQQPMIQPEQQVVTITSEPVTYTIKKGDTLIGISMQHYGNEAVVSEICSLNGIDNPDDIKVGEKILLP